MMWIHSTNRSCTLEYGGYEIMWITISIILAIALLIALGSNSILRNELDALKYTNVYLFSKFVRESDIEDIEREIERAKKQFK